MLLLLIITASVLLCLFFLLILPVRRYFASFASFPQLRDATSARPLAEVFLGDSLILAQHWNTIPDKNVGYLRITDCLAEYTKDQGMLLIWTGWTPWLLLFAPETVEPVLSSPHAVDKSLVYWLFHKWLGQGLLTSNKKKWTYHRKLLTPSFHFQIIHDLVPTIQEHARILCQQIASFRDEQDVVQDVKPVFQRCALDVICESAMGVKVNAQIGCNRTYVEAVDRSGHEFSKRMYNPLLYPDIIYSLTPGGRRYNGYLRTLRNFTVKAIHERQQHHATLQESEPQGLSKEAADAGSGGRPGRKRLSFLDKLISEHERDPHIFTMQDMIDEVQTFMFAGHESTTWAITWTCFLLGHHAGAQERLFQEISSFPDLNLLSLEDFHAMKFLDAVFRESLRLYPLVPIIGRFLWQDLKVTSPAFPCDKIPRFTSLIVLPRLVHRSGKHWQHPERFIPERFLNSAGEGGDKLSQPVRHAGSNDCDKDDDSGNQNQWDENGNDWVPRTADAGRSRHPYAFIPFSGGPRNCIGQKFAMIEGKIILAHIVKSFKLTSLDQADTIQLIMEMTLRSKNPIRIKFQSRER